MVAKRSLRGGQKPSHFFWAALRVSVHPGYFLETRYLQPAGISQDALAKALGISRRRVNELICGKRRVTPDTAVRLALYLNTDVAFWLEMQFSWDLHEAQHQYYDLASKLRMQKKNKSGK